MKRVTLFTMLFILIGISGYGQYYSPGSGISWDMADLVDESSGAVTYSDGIYSIHQDLFIISPDTILLENNSIIQLSSAVLITVQGVWKTNPPDSILFTAMDTLQSFKSFRFEDSNESVLKNCIVEYGGGVDILNSDMLIMGCIFRKNDKSNSTGTIDLFQSNVQIINCEFYYNAGPAVLSGANVECSPLIQGNIIYRNNTENTNMPQINLGTSHPGEPIHIVGNTIEGFYDKAGGIAITTLAGGELNCIIDSNHIYNNRYGITAYGFDITSVISNNHIYNNNIENLPMQGGSGINFWGGTSNTSQVFGNTIYGNLWGITNTGDAITNLGQVEPDTLNTGRNRIFDNGNLGIEYALYNNTPNDIFAQNNFWGSYNLDSVEMVIFHFPDDETLGIVNYLPIMDSLTTSVQQKLSLPELIMFPNPAENFLSIQWPAEFKETQKCKLILRNSAGKLIRIQELSDPVTKLNLSMLKPGLYFVEISSRDQAITSKFIKY